MWNRAKTVFEDGCDNSSVILFSFGSDLGCVCHSLIQNYIVMYVHWSSVKDFELHNLAFFHTNYALHR